ncbi:MAG: hypothetical protein ACKVZJ_10355 [Phycisphaerales bacterium]
MAKKQAVKTVGTTEQDVLRLTAVKALDRAGSAITGQMDRKGSRLPAGSYALDLEVKITGDLVVAPDVETSGSEAPTDKPAELLAALFAGLDQDEANTLVARAMDALKRAEETAKGKDEYAAGEALLQSTLETFAKRRKRWRVSPSGYRAGATTGQPAVKVTGNVNGNTVEVQIETAA